MDLQHLNKIEARLQDLEHRVMQPATEGIALSSVSIEQETLSGVLNSVLPQTKPEGYSSVATQAAEAIKAAFAALSTQKIGSNSEGIHSAGIDVTIDASEFKVAVTNGGFPKSIQDELSFYRWKDVLERGMASQRSATDDRVSRLNTRLDVLVETLGRRFPAYRGL